MMSDRTILAEEAPQSFGSQVRAAISSQGRGYAQFWPGRSAKSRTLSSHHAPGPPAKNGLQRAIVKARTIETRLSAERLRSHFRYLQRAGVSSSSNQVPIYGDHDEIDPRDFFIRAAGDYRHVRLVVSVENGSQIPDQRPIIRELMQQMRRDLQFPVDWVAVDHYNTAHPHTHVVLRVNNSLGRHQFVAPAYLKLALRAHLRAIVTRNLGPDEPGCLVNQAQIATYHGPSAVDRIIARTARNGKWALDRNNELAERCQSIARVRALQRLGFAEELTPGTFRLAPNGSELLRGLEARARLFESMARELAHIGVVKAPSQLDLFRCDRAQRPILGRILCAKQIGSAEDFLIVEAADGRAIHISTGPASNQDVPLTKGMIIKVAPSLSRDEQAIDEKIAAIAALNHGIYCAALHAKHDRTAAPEFLRAHERRLVDLAASGIIADKVAGVWHVGPQFLDRAVARQQLEINILSYQPLERLVAWRGATWLDRLGPHRLRADHLKIAGQIGNESTGFPMELTQCLKGRAEFLSKQGWVKEGFVPSALYSELRRRELKLICRRICERLEQKFVRAPAIGTLMGSYRGQISLASERLAIVQRRNDFTIIPWSRAIESTRGRAVTILIDRNGRSSIGRDRVLDQNF